MTAGKIMAAGWLFVTAMLSWLWWDTSLPWFLVAMVASVLVALVGATSGARWAGGVLVLAAISLGVPAVLALVVISSGHGSNARPAAVAFTYLTFFVVLPIAAMTFIVGMKRLFFKNGPAGSTTMFEQARHLE